LTGRSVSCNLGGKRSGVSVDFPGNLVIVFATVTVNIVNRYSERKLIFNLFDWQIETSVLAEV
jgi:purine-cytosine permease-like protein